MMLRQVTYLTNQTANEDSLTENGLTPALQ